MSRLSITQVADIFRGEDSTKQKNCPTSTVILLKWGNKGVEIFITIYYSALAQK
jgi:hypothetical protein